MTLPALQPRHAIATLNGTDHLPPLSQMVFALSVLVMTWEVRSRTRRALSKMTAEDLSDIGLNLTEAQREARRFFWQG